MNLAPALIKAGYAAIIFELIQKIYGKNN